MSSHFIVRDKSYLFFIDRLFFKLEILLNLLAGFLVLAIVVASMTNILGRSLFNKPFFGYFDVMAQAVPLIAFLGLSYCQRLGGHIRLEILLGHFKKRILWMVEAILSLFMIYTTAALCYGSFLHTLRAYRLGDSTEDIGFAIWPIKCLIFIMFFLLIIRLFLQLMVYVKLIINPKQKVVGIHVLMNAQQQAKQEAELE